MYVYYYYFLSFFVILSSRRTFVSSFIQTFEQVTLRYDYLKKCMIVAIKRFKLLILGMERQNLFEQWDIYTQTKCHTIFIFSCTGDGTRVK